MNPLYIVGGKQRGPRPLNAGNQDWNGYESGLIVELDPSSGRWTIRSEYSNPPAGYSSADGAVLFQAGALEQGTLYLCTQTEILEYSLPDFQPLLHLSLPCFNDLHHVRPTPEGNLIVANAGLEMVIEITPGGDIRRAWNVLGEEPWGRFSPSVDYRGLSTKPHRAHPNYIFYIRGEPWATRFQQGDAIALNHPGQPITLSGERVHDGLVVDDRVYFTTVTGKIVIADTRALQVAETIDLYSMHPDDVLLGWTRGLYHDGDYLWVGFSRIRPTRFRENVAWVMRGFKRAMPTHIGCYDLARRRLVAEFDLEPAGLSAIYSIFPAVPAAPRQAGIAVDPAPLRSNAPLES